MDCGRIEAETKPRQFLYGSLDRNLTFAEAVPAGEHGPGETEQLFFPHVISGDAPSAEPLVPDFSIQQRLGSVGIEAEPLVDLEDAVGREVFDLTGFRSLRIEGAEALAKALVRVEDAAASKPGYQVDSFELVYRVAHRLFPARSTASSCPRGNTQCWRTCRDRLRTSGGRAERGRTRPGTSRRLGGRTLTSASGPGWRCAAGRSGASCFRLTREGYTMAYDTIPGDGRRGPQRQNRDGRGCGS